VFFIEHFMTQSDKVFVGRPVRRRGKRESRKLSFLFYQSLFGPFVFVRAIYRQIVVLGLMFVWGALIFSYFEGLPPVAAFLASVSTITTIGFYVPHGSNFFTMTTAEAVLLIIMIVISVGAGASILQSSVNTIAKGDFAKSQAERRLIRRLKDHAIVLGYTHWGRYVMEKLEDLGLDFVIVTKDAQVYDELLRNDVFVVLERETQSMTALTEAGIDRASIVVSAHEKDADNMLAILSARKLHSDIRIISVVHDNTLVETARNAGADIVIPSSVTVGHLLALSAVTRNLVGVVFSERIGTKEIAEFSVFKASPLIGKTLPQISRCATIIGLVRDGKVVRNLFDPTLAIKEDDTLLVFGDPACLLSLEGEAKAL
jgi:Trk K+ transport system NAD-binding subunit